jgi:hypothetical protein
MYIHSGKASFCSTSVLRSFAVSYRVKLSLCIRLSTFLAFLNFHQAFSQTFPVCLADNSTAAKVTNSTKVSSYRAAQSIWRIPVVVHVVYNSPEQNISDEQVRSQIRVLTQDFRRTNPDTGQTLAAFKSVAADCEIEFYLAQADEAGNPTTGITRTYTLHGPFGNSDIHQTTKGGKDAWNSQLYLNIWVCNLAPGIKGYASSPLTAKPDEDGLVIHYRYFGTLGTALAPYHKGRTAIHEAGHFLGLSHLWGISGNCTDDDGIADTPPQESASAGCQLGRVSCGNLNMVQNFMDYTDDACMNLFTSGQKAVMRQTLQQYRSQLIDTTTVITGVEKSPGSSDWRVYPNPSASGVITISHPLLSEKATLVITDLLGKKIEPAGVDVQPNYHRIQLPPQKGFFLLSFTLLNKGYFYKVRIE